MCYECIHALAPLSEGCVSSRSRVTDRPTGHSPRIRPSVQLATNQSHVRNGTKVILQEVRAAACVRVAAACLWPQTRLEASTKREAAQEATIRDLQEQVRRTAGRP